MSEISQEVIERIQSEILDALEKVIDPELGVDIVNLGLVYGIELEEKGHCVIKMTLTSMGCPMADVIIEHVKRELLALDHVNSVDVQLVWTPLWTSKRMSRYARMVLGVRA